MVREEIIFLDERRSAYINRYSAAVTEFEDARRRFNSLSLKPFSPRNLAKEWGIAFPRSAGGEGGVSWASLPFSKFTAGSLRAAALSDSEMAYSSSKIKLHFLLRAINLSPAPFHEGSHLCRDLILKFDIFLKCSTSRILSYLTINHELL